MADWYTGVSVEHVVSMRENEGYFTVVDEGLCSEFFSFDEFFDEKVVFSGVFFYIGQCRVKFLKGIHSCDSAASRGVHRFENKRELQTFDSFWNIRVCEFHLTEAGGADTVFFVFGFH